VPIRLINNLPYSNFHIRRLIMDQESQDRREEFKEQLTLGFVQALGEFSDSTFFPQCWPLYSESLPDVTDVVLHDHAPADSIAIASWEQRYSTVLPHEIRDFYLAADGFKLTWSFNHAGK